MSHSFTKLWIHSVFSTKDRIAPIRPHFETLLYHHIKQTLCEDLKSELKIINGFTDHVHILFLINAEISVAHAMKIIKANSSHWVNQMSFIPDAFTWQTGYAAFSISEKYLPSIEQYIQ